MSDRTGFYLFAGILSILVFYAGLSLFTQQNTSSGFGLVLILIGFAGIVVALYNLYLIGEPAPEK